MYFLLECSSIILFDHFFTYIWTFSKFDQILYPCNGETHTGGSAKLGPLTSTSFDVTDLLLSICVLLATRYGPVR